MLTFEILDNNISGSVAGKFFNIPDSPEARKAMEEFAAREITDLAAQEALVKDVLEYCSRPIEDVLEQDCPYLVIDRKTGTYRLRYNQKVSSVAMPQALVDRILASHAKGLDFMPVIKMWVRFLRNPLLPSKGTDFAELVFNFVNLTYVHPELKADLVAKGFTEEIATQRATIYQMQITKEGLLSGYKVSREIMHKYVADEQGNPKKVDRYQRTFDVNTGKITGTMFPPTVEERLFEPAVQGQSGDAFYSGTELGHFIRVGQVHRLPDWSFVNTNDNASCVKGLHVGGLYYINGYQGEIHNVFIDPMHIGAVPDDTSGAIRCLQYFVYGSLVGVNGAIYHSSEYAKLTDAEWQAMLAEAVAEAGDRANRAAERISELQAL